MEAQLASARANSGKTGFEVIGGPFVDAGLGCGDALRIGLVRGFSGRGSLAVLSDGGRERRLLLLVELLEAGALLFPVPRLAPLDREQDAETERDRKPGNALRPQQAEDGRDHGCA